MGAWRCACGRTVPQEVGYCRCGQSRTVQTATRTRPQGSDGRVIRLVGTVGLVALLGWGAYRWYASYTPPAIGGYNAPVEDARPVEPTGPPPSVPGTALGSAETRPTHPPVATMPEPSPAAAAAPAGPAPIAGVPTPIAETAPPTAASPLETPADGPSESDQLRERIAAFRSQYGPLKRRIEQLEREVGELTQKASRSIGGGNSGATTEADAVRSRLSAAQDELDRSRIALAGIEEQARRAGVAYGQLY